MLLFAACARTEFPPWFDGIHRLPLHSVLVNGQRLAYLDEGQGPPLILIHGFGGSMWQWEYQSTALARQFRVITLDLHAAQIQGFFDIPMDHLLAEPVLRVQESQIERGEAAIRELRYRPNAFARGLMLRKSGIVGLVLPDLHGEFYSEIIRGANLQAREMGRNLLVSSALPGDDADSWLSAIGQRA